MLKICETAEWALSFPNLPRSGMMQSGTLYQLGELVSPSNGSVYGLLPALSATEWKGTPRSRYKGSAEYRGSRMAEGLRTGLGSWTLLHPHFCEVVMGYPIMWTELTPLGTL